MQRRHFEAIADAMRQTNPMGAVKEADETVALQQWRMTVRAMADMCAREYKGGMSFKRTRFYDACGYVA